MKLTEVMHFLSPAIDKRNKLNPVLEHVRITQGYAIAYDGVLAMAAPVGIPLTCTPNGTLLEQGVKRFGDEFAATQLTNGDLFFQGKGFSVTIPCTTDEFPMPDFSGQPVMGGVGLVNNLKKLLPFTTVDDNFPWQASILVRQGKMYASCGHTAAFCSIALDPSIEMQIPLEAAEAIVAIGEDPDYLAIREDCFIAVFSGGRYLSCPPIYTKWESVAKIGKSANLPDGILPGFFKAVKDIKPFGKVGQEKTTFYIRDGYVCSSSDNRGAKADVEGLVGNWYWLYASVKLIEANATALRFENGYVSWAGDGIEGRARLGKIA